MTKSTSELERDAERTRADLSSTLDEIRGRLEPGQIADRAFTYARNNGGSDFLRNAATQARDNPLPVLLIGAGVAWLMSGRKPGTGPSFGDLRGSGGRTAHDARHAASEATSAVGDAMSSAKASVRDAFASGRSSLQDAGSTVGSFASSTSKTFQSGGAQVGQIFGDLPRMCAENPIAVGAIGLAIGAAIGAAFPSTETENRLMGAEADDLKSGLRTKAAEGVDRVERAVEAALDEAKEPPRSGT